MRKFGIFALLLVCVSASMAQEKKNPTFEEVIALQNIGTPEISPDGKNILFTKSGTDWQNNRFDTEIWLIREGERPFQLTNNLDGSSTSPQWSPDGQWISFLSKRHEKTQVQVIRLQGGEAMQVTHSGQNIRGFEWSPDGSKIAFMQAADDEKRMKQRTDKYGGYAIEDDEYSMNELWLVDFNPDRLAKYSLPAEDKDSVYKAITKGEAIIKSDSMTVMGFEWSPNGQYIAFDFQPDPLINSFFDRDIAIYDVEKATYRIAVANSSYDGFSTWSPDSKSILYTSDLDNRQTNYYQNTRVFTQNLNGKKTKELAVEFDEDIGALSWEKDGIYALARLRTTSKLLRIDPKKGDVTVLQGGPDRIYSFDFSANSEKLVIRGNNQEDLTEIYLTNNELNSPVKLTNSSAQIVDWLYAKSEVITWKSKDGVEIEGVLHKPYNYDPAKKYPLLVNIHGGPTGVSTPTPVPAYVYPAIQWLNKGALVLRPNYRGSAGYGADFRALNVKNLGVGDAWDVESGVQYLIDQGLVDGDKVGSMGWSQGGYISAFLATNSTMFKAISVGAGISNWMTYYVNTDIHPFTRQYLLDTPWSNKEIYEMTSPMTNINKAQTPTLIQHGEFDRRVPTANAFELYQGLQDVGVETKLIIYKGFGHGITKPKERLAAMWHNWQWFGQYLWGEEIEIPK
jgi:dipeptidyl aminopeptidase/acylaminoacyl peptidase